MIVADLLTNLGFNIDRSALNQYNNTIRQTALDAAKMASGISTALFGGLIAFSAKSFGTFEAQMNQTLAVLDNATEEQAKKLEEQALKLGASTKFNAKQVAEGQGELAKAGMKFNDVMVATTGTLSLAAAAGIEVGQAAKVTTGIIAGFGLESKDASLVADILAQAANKSATGVNEIGEAMKYAASSAKTANQDFGDIAALASVLGNNMIEGSMAGTALSSIIGRLQAPVGGAAKLIKDYGIQTHNSSGEMLNIIDIIQNFQKVAKGLNQQKQAELFKVVFGEEAGRSAATIINTDIAKIKELQGAMKNASGSAGEMSAKMNKGLLPAIEEMFGAVESLAIVIGKELAPVIIKAANFIGALASKFASASPFVKQLTAGFILFGSALSAALLAGFTLNTLLPTLQAIKVSVMSLKLATLGMWAAWALGAIVVGLLIEDLYNFFTGGKSVIGDLTKDVPLLKVELFALRDWFIENQGTIREWGFLAIEIAGQIFNGFQVMGSYLYELFTILLPPAITIFTVILNTILGIINMIISVVTTLGSIFLSVFTMIVSPLETVKSILSSIGDIAGTIANKISNISLPSSVTGLISLLPGMGGGGNQINSTVQVNVGGSNATPRQIAGAVADGNKKSLRGELATAGRNNPKVKQ